MRLSIFLFVLMATQTIQAQVFSDEKLVYEYQDTLLTRFYTGDLNGDFWDDVIVMAGGEMRLLWMENRQAGSFSRAQQIDYFDDDPKDILVHDYNSDFLDDIYILFEDYMLMYTNNGDLTFDKRRVDHVAEEAHKGIVKLNISGDEGLDLVTYGDHTLQVFENEGDTYLNPVLLDSFPNEIRSLKTIEGQEFDYLGIEFQSDSSAIQLYEGRMPLKQIEQVKLDSFDVGGFDLAYLGEGRDSLGLYVVSRNGELVVRFINQGSDVWKLDTLYDGPGGTVNSVQVADYDNDGDLDITVVQNGKKIHAYVNTNMDYVREQIQLVSSYDVFQYQITDITQDGVSEILFFNNNYNLIIYAENYARSIYSPIFFFESPEFIYNPKSETYDLRVWANQYRSGVSFKDDDGLGSYTDYYERLFRADGTPAFYYQSVDLDGDGDFDYVVDFQDILGWIENNDGAFNGEWETLLPVEYNSGRFTFADLDGDGAKEVITQRFNSEEMAVYGYSFKDSAFIQKQTFDLGGKAMIMEAADLDNDGDEDLVLGIDDYLGTNDARLATIENVDGFLDVSTLKDIRGIRDYLLALYLQDLDDDGLVDIIWSDGGADAEWYKNLGSFEFAFGGDLKFFDRPESFQATDLDNDGDTDFLIQSNRRISFGINDGSGFEIYLFRRIDRFEQVSYADVDQDGDIDILRVNEGNRILWHENLSLCPEEREATEVDIVSCGPYTWIDGNTYEESTRVIHRIPRSSSCDSVVILNLSMRDNFQTEVIKFESGTPFLIAKLRTAEDYQWLRCENGSYETIVGARDRVFEPTEPGFYAVAITYGGCVDTSACIDVSTVSSDQIIRSQEVVIYPNPVQHTLFVQTAEGLSFQSARLFSLNGRVVQEWDVMSGNKLSLSAGLTSGLYFLELRDEKQQRVVKKVYVR